MIPALLLPMLLHGSPGLAGEGVEIVIVPGPHYIVASGAFSPGAVVGYMHTPGAVEAGVHQAGTIAGSVKP